ncbi:hypothetical protein T03_5043 [Trichinella britovi]|uniref:Uncharacterized protein n=1 Tax=Trichinella britovi TaxID=45882 RepID=A0A0V1D876_TRIBR|nr:hypothetical protein T03_5043 [Trichinella britovi]
MSDYFGQRNKDTYPRTAASLCTPSHLTMTIINRENSFTSNQSEETVDHVSLYLTPLAFGAPTGGNALCLNMFGTLSTISSHYKIKKQDSDSVANPLQGETMGMQKLRIVCLSTKGVSKQDGIVEVPEETV